MDDKTLARIKADPNFPSIYHDPWFSEVTDIRRGRYGTTRAKVDGEALYFYKGFELFRNEGTSAGCYGAWRASLCLESTLKDLVAAVDERIARRARERAAAAEPVMLGAAIGDDIKWHGVPGGR